jgi:integrase
VTLNISSIFDKIVTSDDNFNASRRSKLLSLLKQMHGETTVIEPEQLPRLRKRFKEYLQAKPMTTASTVRQQTYRLSSLLELAVEQGLIELEVLHPAFEFPQFVPSQDKKDRRRCNAYNAFRDWCDEEGIGYSTVSRGTFFQYRERLKSDDSSWKEIQYLDLRRFWNENVASGGLKVIDVPPYRDETRLGYGLPRQRWPEGVEEQYSSFERGATGRARSGEKRWFEPLRAPSLTGYEKEVRQLLGYAANICRVDLDERSLADILRDDRLVIDFIKWHIRERARGLEHEYHAESLNRYARLLEWLDPAAEEPSCYVTIALGLDPESARDKFPQKPITFDTFLQAMNNAVSDAEQRWRNEKHLGRARRLSAAVNFRDALMFAFLILRPIREKNVLMMELGRHLFRSHVGNWDLFFSARETKGGVVHEAPFPPELVNALELFLAEVREELRGEEATSIVFLSRTGKPLLPGDIWRRITRIGQRYLGIKTNPHIFRALVPSAYLLEYPDKLQEVQALLGHACVETTLKFYIRTYSQIASRRAADFIRAECPHFNELMAITK